MSDKTASEVMLGGVLLAIVMPRAIQFLSGDRKTKEGGLTSQSADPVQEAVAVTEAAVAPGAKPWFELSTNAAPVRH